MKTNFFGAFSVGLCKRIHFTKCVHQFANELYVGTSQHDSS